MVNKQHKVLVPTVHGGVRAGLVHGDQLPWLVLLRPLSALLLSTLLGLNAGSTIPAVDVAPGKINFDACCLVFAVQLSNNGHALQLLQGGMPILLMKLVDGRVHGC